MILPAQTIRKIKPVSPFFERTSHNGMTFGLGPAGYDVRIAERVVVGVKMVLASTLERFEMPIDLLGQVCDKSTWARRGVAVQNTIIEPGWRGYLTLELTKRRTDRDPGRRSNSANQLLPAGGSHSASVQRQVPGPAVGTAAGSRLKEQK